VNDELVYPRERTLGPITLVLGVLAWLVIVVGTVGIALVYLLIGFLFYLFAQSALIAWLRGNGVLLSAQQLPDLRERFDACCAKLGIDADRSRRASSAATTSSSSPTSSTRCRRIPTASTSTSATSSAMCA
jgi:hypothetical protein